MTDARLWVADMDGGPQQLRAFDLDGGRQPAPEIPPVSSVSSYSARLAKLGPDRIAWRASRSPSRRLVGGGRRGARPVARP